MPTYSLLGLSVFIPDLTDIENSIVTPIENAVSEAVTQIVQPIFNSLSAIGTTIANTVIQSLQEAGGILAQFGSSISALVVSGLTGAWSGLVTYVINPIEGFIQNAVIPFFQSLPGQITSGFQAYIVSPIQTFIQSTVIPSLTNLALAIARIDATILTAANQYIVQPITSFLQTALSNLIHNVSTIIDVERSVLIGIGSTVSGGINSLLGFITPALSSIGSGIASIPNLISGAVAQISNAIGPTLNSISASVSSSFNVIGNAISGALRVLWNDMVAFFNDYIKPFFAEAQRAITNGLTYIQNSIKGALISVLPKSPEDAFNSALTFAEIGIATFAIGEVGSLAIEALYPTKHWGIPEAFNKGMELLGITEIAASLYGIVIESGWRLNLQYYFNYRLQPMKPNPQTSIRGLWYGLRTQDQVRNDLRYEGYNDEFIELAIGTSYRPISAFILEKLVELQVIDNATAIKQMQMSGFDPKDSAALVQAFQNLSLQGFQSTAKSIIFSLFKDGFMDVGIANGIMSTFAIPSDQQKWILTLANYQFKYEQQVLLKTFILDGYAKGIYDATTAESALEGIGMDATRAGLLVKIKGLTVGAAATKAQKAEILAEAIALPIEVS